MLAVSFDSCCYGKLSTVISLSGPVVYISVYLRVQGSTYVHDPPWTCTIYQLYAPLNA
jgi:hypothetical protein